MDDITQNGFDHPKFGANTSILVLMPYKFGTNTSILMLMPKKTGSGSHYNFIFS
jgi:hypothetical protein